MLKKIWRFTKKAMLWMFVSSLLYVIICKWVMPPITITQISNGFGYGLKRDYVSGAELSYNAKLAAIASEDQAFPDHFGLDFDAIEKSLKPKKGKNTNYPWEPLRVPSPSKPPKMYFCGREEAS